MPGEECSWHRSKSRGPGVDPQRLAEVTGGDLGGQSVTARAGDETGPGPGMGGGAMTGKAGARFWRNWDLARGLFCFLLIKEDITLFSFVIPEMTWTPTVAPRSACQVWRGSRAQ